MTAPRKDCKVALVIFLQLSLACLSESIGTSNQDQYFRRTLAQSAPILDKDPDLLFSELDKDGDGNIDPEEFNALFGLVPSDSPSMIPSEGPSTSPSFIPTRSTNPSRKPSNAPSESLFPSSFPSGRPSKSINPSSQPSTSMIPTDGPTHKPTLRPSDLPSKIPTGSPSKSMNPTPSPSISSIPSDVPSRNPSSAPSDLPTKVPTGSPSKSMNPTPSPSISSIPSDVPSRNPSSAPSDLPTKVPTGSPSKSMNPTPSPSTRTTPSNAPFRKPTFGPSDVPSKIRTEIPSQATNPTSFPSTWMMPSDAPLRKPTVGPSDIPSKIQTAPTSSSDPNAGLEFERIVAFTNVTLQSVEGLMNEEAKVVFEEAALVLLIDRYPRMDRYDIDFLFVLVESQVFEDGRRLQDASRIGDLTVFLQVAAKIFPTTPSGFDFQSSMNAFFMAHDILLMDRLETVGISFNPDTVQSEKANSNPEKADKTDKASASNRFPPAATVGIVLAMVAVLVTGVFVASRSMRQTPSEDYSLESPAGRLGAAPSYDDLDPEAIFMSLSELSKQDEGKTIIGNTDLSSITSYPTRHSTATGNSSHLAGLYVQQSSSFASTEDGTDAPVVHSNRSGPRTTAGQKKGSRTSSNLRDNESDTLWDLPSSQMDDSTSDDDGCSTDRLVTSAESTARQRKRRLEHRLRESKQRSYSQSNSLLKEEKNVEETFKEYANVKGLMSVSGDGVSHVNDGSSTGANPSYRTTEHTPAQKQVQTMHDSDVWENGNRIPINKLFQKSAPNCYDRMSDDGSGMDVEVTKESFFEEKENQQEPTSTLGWLQKLGKRNHKQNGGKPLFGGLTLNFGRRKRGTESEMGTRWQNLQETSYCSDDAGDEPETILLDHAAYNEDGLSPSATSADRRNRPPLLDLRELGGEDDVMPETPVETPLTEFPIPSSGGASAEPDGYALTSRNKRKMERPLRMRSNSQPESSDSGRQGDPPTAAEHRQAMLAARGRRLRSGMKSKESVPRKRLHRVSFHQEATAIPVEGSI